jgi:hypothetical protein
MKLFEGIEYAYNRKWSMANTFTVQLHLGSFLTDTVGKFEDDLNISVVSFTTPDFNNTPIEAYIANKWIIANGRDELKRFSITFKDHSQMALYRKFLQIYEYTKERYFDDVAMTVILLKDADYYNEYDLPIINFDDTIIESVSNLALSNDTEAQIAEFTVSFKCVTARPTINF